MPKYIELDEVNFTIKGEIPLTLSIDMPEWTPDYKEGYVDGLKRALELVDELEVLTSLKCLYCDNLTNENPHFQSYCCKRGMCDDCFNGLVGTMEQYQIDGGEEEEYSDQVAEAEKHGYSYLCFDHMKKNTELAN